MVVSRACHTANLFKGNFMVVIGGVGFKNKILNNFVAFDLETNIWEDMSSLSKH